MKFTLQSLKPRNPYVAAGLRRAAGAHRTLPPRQQAARALRQELRLLQGRTGGPLP